MTLGDYDAAQEHAEAMLEHGFSGHWGLDGLTPAMRYTLAGGVNYVAENASGVKGIRGEDWGPQYQRRGWRKSLDIIHQGLMDSPGHRKTILAEWQSRVILGIACNDYTCSVVQMFEGDYVEFTKPPAISSEGVLAFTGSFKERSALERVQVWYHQPPHALTLGQLHAAYSYDLGQEPATFIIKPAPSGIHYEPSDLMPVRYEWTASLDPYSANSGSPRNRTAFVPWTVADLWHPGPSRVDVKADIRDIVRDKGPGVYIIVLWGEKAGDLIPLTNYTVFVD